MISHKPSVAYRKIRYYVDLIESSHNAIMAQGLREVKDFGDHDIITEYRSIVEERRENSGNLADAAGYLLDVELLGKLATLSGQTEIAVEIAQVIIVFRDNMETLQKVLKDIRLSQLHQALCANAYNN